MTSACQKVHCGSILAVVMGVGMPVILGSWAAGGCSRSQAGDPPPPADNTGDRPESPPPPPDRLRVAVPEVVPGNTAFAFDLYRHVRGEGGNIFYSPYSISLALAMTYAGARGDTERQMADVLHFTLPQERLHPTFHALDRAIRAPQPRASEKEGERFRLDIANRLWGQRDYTFRPEFLDGVAKHYGAGLAQLDFVNDPEPSRLIINDWVSDQTEKKIQDLIPQGEITPLTCLVLTNAIYFLGPWALPFPKTATRDDAFHLLNGDEVKVPMMSQTIHFEYARGEDYQVVQLPYKSSKCAMVIILPAQDHFREVEGGFDSARLGAILHGLRVREVALTMPKFKFSWGAKLKEVLMAMGMPLAFDAMPTGETVCNLRAIRADFSGMDGCRQLCVSQVIHKAFVAVDEDGTEATAATAVIMMKATSVQPKPEVMRIDRPFIFLIRDTETGTILFLGRVLHP